ncbi:MAG: hypothetical protein AAF684_08585 [Pseudomonadota bacterium]
MTTAAFGRRARKTEAWEFKLLRALSFVYFLGFVAVARLLPRAWRPAALREGGYGRLFADARAGANTVVGYAFMG